MKTMRIKYNRYIYAIAAIIIIASAVFLFQKFFVFRKDLFPPPPMGWNGWNAFRCDNATEKNILEATDALVSSGMRDVGYDYVNIDDCWQKERSIDGTIIVDEERFPHGMKYVSDYIHDRSFKFGIYTSAGRQTCEKRPGSFGYEQQDINTYVSWGVDYVKVDWCGIDVFNAPILFSLWHSLVRNSARPIKLSIAIANLGVEKPWIWGRYVGDLWRVNNDIRDDWDSITSIIDVNEPLSSYAGNGHWNDPDMLVVGLENLTNEENISHFGMWAMMNAPLIAGNNLRTMSNETRKILTNKEIIAINQDPLGVQSVQLFSRDGYEVWSKPLAYPWVRAIAIFNRNDTAGVVRINWKDVGLRLPFFFRDTVNHHWIWSWDNPLIVAVPAHGLKLLKAYGWFSPHALPNGKKDPQISTGYLSDQPWVYAENGLGPVEKNLSNGEGKSGDGSPMSIHGKTYKKGLGVHAYSEVFYHLGGTCEELSMIIGLDDEILEGNPEVQFLVYGDGVPLYKSEDLGRYDPPSSVSVDLTGVDNLILEVRSTDPNTIDSMHADWANLYITCH